MTGSTRPPADTAYVPALAETARAWQVDPAPTGAAEVLGPAAVPSPGTLPGDLPPSPGGRPGRVAGLLLAAALAGVLAGAGPQRLAEVAGLAGPTGPGAVAAPSVPLLPPEPSAVPRAGLPTVPDPALGAGGGDAALPLAAPSSSGVLLPSVQHAAAPTPERSAGDRPAAAPPATAAAAAPSPVDGPARQTGTAPASSGAAAGPSAAGTDAGGPAAAPAASTGPDPQAPPRRTVRAPAGSDTLDLTEADSGVTALLEPGQRLVLSLVPPGRWGEPAVTANGVLRLLDSTPAEDGSRRVRWSALSPGETEVWVATACAPDGDCSRRRVVVLRVEVR